MGPETVIDNWGLKGRRETYTKKTAEPGEFEYINSYRLQQCRVSREEVVLPGLSFSYQQSAEPNKRESGSMWRLKGKQRF